VSNVRWHNVYKDSVSPGHYCPYYAAHFGTQVAEVDWLRVEQRWNGHWLRPCVGMRAEDTSHKWRDCGCGDGLECAFTSNEVLEPRA
jgi:hypothetical protein